MILAHLLSSVFVLRIELSGVFVILLALSTATLVLAFILLGNYISLKRFNLYRPQDEIEHVIKDASVCCVFSDEHCVNKFIAATKNCPSLHTIVVFPTTQKILEASMNSYSALICESAHQHDCSTHTSCGTSAFSGCCK